MGKLHVLITGGAGRVASILRQHWGDRYQLRLADVRPVEDLDLHEEYVALDITDLEAFTAASYSPPASTLCWDTGRTDRRPVGRCRSTCRMSMAPPSAGGRP